MITKIYIENFKGIGSPGVTIDLKPITLLFGANSAGKSTVFQAMHYAREILLNKNCAADRIELGGNIIDYGGFRNVVNNQILQNRIIIRIDFDVKSSQLPYFDFYFEQELDNEDPENLISHLRESIDSAYIELEVFWDYGTEKPRVNYHVGFNNEHFGSIIENNPGGRENLLVEKLNLHHNVFLDNDNMNANEQGNSYPSQRLLQIYDCIINSNVYGENGDVVFNEIEVLMQETAVPIWGKALSFDDLIFRKPVNELTDYHKAEFENINKQKKIFHQILNIIFVGLGEYLTNELSKMNYVGPLREILDRHHFSKHNSGNVNWSNGLLAWEVLRNGDVDLFDKVNSWLQKFDTGYQIAKKDYRLLNTDSDIHRKIIQGIVVDEDDLKSFLMNSDVLTDLFIKDIENTIELKPIDIGVGISQIIPVIVAAIYQNNSILAIEQPELHTHPKMQVDLGDLFIEQINTKPELRFLIETHSEHLMLRLLRRIKETIKGKNEEIKLQIEQKFLSIYFFESSTNGLVCTKINIDERGRFSSKWPNGFFDERYEEMI